jgi:hypothetical protein
MKLAGQARHAFMLAGDRSDALPEQKASLCDVGVYAELAVQWLLAPAANGRITLSSVPSGVPGAARPSRADVPSPISPRPGGRGGKGSVRTYRHYGGGKGSVRTYRHYGVDKGPMGRVKG